MSDDDTVMTVSHHELELPTKGVVMHNISIPVVRHVQLFYAILKEEDRKKAKELSEEMTEFYNTCRTFNDRPLIPGEYSTFNRDLENLLRLMGTLFMIKTRVICELYLGWR